MTSVYIKSIFLIAFYTSFYLTNGAPSTSVDNTFPIIKMPEECQSKTFCFIKGKDYPSNLIEDLLKKNSLNFTVITQEHPETKQRDDDGENYKDTGCLKTSVDQRPIYYIRDKNNDTRVVLQSETYFRQIVDVQECSNSRPRRSFVFSDSDIENHNLRCVNLKFHYNFLVLNKNFTDIDLVQNVGGLPVHCVIRAM